MEITIASLVKFLIKFVIIVLFIWLIAVVTPRLAKKSEPLIKKLKKGNSDTYRTDVFGASYPKDNNTKNKENNNTKENKNG